jgi:phage terminase Nu1 subunit (DNA packaging protein)
MGKIVYGPWRHDPLLTRPRLSAFWNVSPRTLARYERDGMPSEKHGDEIRYRFSRVQAWRQRRERGAA